MELNVLNKYYAEESLLGIASRMIDLTCHYHPAPSSDGPLSVYVTAEFNGLVHASDEVALLLLKEVECAGVLVEARLNAGLLVLPQG